METAPASSEDQDFIQRFEAALSIARQENKDSQLLEIRKLLMPPIVIVEPEAICPRDWSADLLILPERRPHAT